MAAVTTTAGRFAPRLWALALYTIPRVDLAQACWQWPDSGVGKPI